MQNLDLIISNLQSLSTTELLLIAKDPATIEALVIPHLQKELLKRGEKDAADALENYELKEEKPLAKLSEDEIKLQIQERIAQGESIESIRLDLQENGIDLFDIAFDNIEKEEEKINFITNLKEQGQDDETITTELQKEYGITTDETEKLKERRQSHAQWNLILGYALAFGAIMIAFASLDSGRFPVRPCIILCVAIWRIIEGYKMRK